MWGLNPSVNSVSLFFAKSRLPGRETRESQTLTFLADALSVLDHLRRSAGTVLRKWKTIPAKAVGTAAPPICFRPQPLESRLPAATYDALLAEDCGLSAGILSTTRAIYKRVSWEVGTGSGGTRLLGMIHGRGRGAALYARESASARLKFSSSGEKANERTMPARSINASIGRAVAP